MAKAKVHRIDPFQETPYEAKKHCIDIKEYISRYGTIYQFCADHKLSDKTFYKWLALYPEFQDYYRQGMMLSRSKWEKEGALNYDNEEWNMRYWELQGEIRYGINKANRVRVMIDPNANPHEQYKQLIYQASFGEYTAAEIKQLMEAINVGVRAYECFKQQKDIDKIKEDLNKMSINHGAHLLPDKSTP